MLEPMPDGRRRHRTGAGDKRSMPVSSPDQIVLCNGKGVCCWPVHPRRTDATPCTHSDHRGLLLRGDAGSAIGNALNAFADAHAAYTFDHNTVFGSTGGLSLVLHVDAQPAA